MQKAGPSVKDPGTGVMLRSKWFWGITGGVGAIAAFNQYDKMEAARIQQSYIASCQKYGDRPLGVTEMPRKLTVLCVEPSYPQVLDVYRQFKLYSLPLLNAAGMDFEWIQVSRKQQAKDLKTAIEKKRADPATAFDGESEEKEAAEKFVKDFKYFQMFGRRWAGEFSPHSASSPDFGAPEYTETIELVYKKPSRNAAKDGIVFTRQSDLEEFIEAVKSSDQSPLATFPVTDLIELDVPTGFFGRISQVIS